MFSSSLQLTLLNNLTSFSIFGVFFLFHASSNVPQSTTTPRCNWLYRNDHFEGFYRIFNLLRCFYQHFSVDDHSVNSWRRLHQTKSIGHPHAFSNSRNSGYHAQLIAFLMSEVTTKQCWPCSMAHFMPFTAFFIASMVRFARCYPNWNPLLLPLTSG